MNVKSKNKNNFIGTLFLVFILLILGVYVYYIDIPKSEKEKKAKESLEKVIPFEKDSVEGFTITNDGADIKMTLQKDGEWLMTSPVSAKGDKSAAEGIISRLQAVTFSSVVDDNPQDLSVYGLSKPSLKVSLKTKEWEKTIITGDTTPLGNGVYVKRLDENRVLLAGTYIRDDLAKSVFDLRDKKVIDIAEERIESIEFINNKNRKILLTKDGSTWMLKEPVNTAADKEEIEGILSTIKSLKVTAFIKDNLDAPSFNLPYHINITADAGTTSKKILLGKRDDDSYYASLSDNNSIISLDGTSVEKIINNDDTTLRDKKIFDIKTEEIDKIALTYKEEEILLKKDKTGEGWLLLKPAETPANDREVSRLISEILYLKVKSFVKNPGKIDTKDIIETLTLWNKDNKKIGEISINRASQNGEDYYGITPAIKDIFTLDNDEVKNLFKTFPDLQDKRLLSFKEEDILKAEFLYQDKLTELIKKGAKKWYLTAEDRAIDETNFNMLLWEVMDVEFEQIISEEGGDLKVYGIDHPSLRITLTEKDIKPKTLFIGKRTTEANLFYAMTNNSRKVYSVKGEAVTRLINGIEGL